jgi:hypothetical protein
MQALSCGENTIVTTQTEAPPEDVRSHGPAGRQLPLKNGKQTPDPLANVAGKMLD